MAASQQACHLSGRLGAQHSALRVRLGLLLQQHGAQVPAQGAVRPQAEGHLGQGDASASVLARLLPVGRGERHVPGQVKGPA